MSKHDTRTITAVITVCLFAVFGVGCLFSLMVGVLSFGDDATSEIERAVNPHRLVLTHDPYVVSTHYIFTEDARVLVMAWSDGTIWTANTNTMDQWEELTQVGEED